MPRRFVSSTPTALLHRSNQQKLSLVGGPFYWRTLARRRTPALHKNSTAVSLPGLMLLHQSDY